MSRDNNSADKLTTCVVLHSYTSLKPDELSITPGEVLQVYKQADDGWWFGQKIQPPSGTARGWFPSNFVQDASDIPDIEKPGPLRYAKAEHDYTAKEEDELTFKQGDGIVVVGSKEDSGWHRGVCGTQFGVFPENFVSFINAKDFEKLKSGSKTSLTSAFKSVVKGKSNVVSASKRRQSLSFDGANTPISNTLTSPPSEKPERPEKSDNRRSIFGAISSTFSSSGYQKNQSSVTSPTPASPSSSENLSKKPHTPTGPSSPKASNENLAKKPTSPTAAVHSSNESLSKKPVLCHAIVTFNYKAKKADELDLVKGTKLEIIEKNSDGWWTGIDDKGGIGMFPYNFVNEISKDAAVASKPPLPKSKPGKSSITTSPNDSPSKTDTTAQPTQEKDKSAGLKNFFNKPSPPQQKPSTPPTQQQQRPSTPPPQKPSSPSPKRGSSATKPTSPTSQLHPIDTSPEKSATAIKDTLIRQFSSEENAEFDARNQIPRNNSNSKFFRSPGSPTYADSVKRKSALFEEKESAAAVTGNAGKPIPNGTGGLTSSPSKQFSQPSKQSDTPSKQSLTNSPSKQHGFGGIPSSSSSKQLGNLTKSPSKQINQPAANEPVNKKKIFDDNDESHIESSQSQRTLNKTASESSFDNIKLSDQKLNHLTKSRPQRSSRSQPRSKKTGGVADLLGDYESADLSSNDDSVSIFSDQPTVQTTVSSNVVSPKTDSSVITSKSPTTKQMGIAAAMYSPASSTLVDSVKSDTLCESPGSNGNVHLNEVSPLRAGSVGLPPSIALESDKLMDAKQVYTILSREIAKLSAEMESRFNKEREERLVLEKQLKLLMEKQK